ncbi:MAG: amidophosphoribosyltransferase [Christensenellaceae bacterium]|nr:amidophosphoribosyltransferase [Christensenellaceae bacterium]
MHEECGVFGAYGLASAAERAALALYALQHRGQEGCGIATYDEASASIHMVKNLGQVKEVFGPKDFLALPGDKAVGHVRYSTTGGNLPRNTQPMLAGTREGTLALVHNGNLSNAAALRRELEAKGLIFQTDSDTEVIAYLLAGELIRTKDIVAALQAAMTRMEGSYSLVMLLNGTMLAVRDPFGMRPLCMGEVEGSPVFASESCAIGAVRGRFVRDLKPGEIVRVEGKNVDSFFGGKPSAGALCIFEHIYFARPDSVIDGQSVYEARLRAGRILAESHPVKADLVIGVPDSGLIAAIGYAEGSGIPHGEGFVINRYIGRTFIEPTQEMRASKVRLKLSPLRRAVEGKRVVMVDDSLVRGTTMGPTVALLKKAGAAEVHVRICAPPFLYPCYFGTDVPSRELLASVRWSHEELTHRIGADSLGFLPLNRVHDLAPNSGLGFCDGCFSGKYPYEVAE